MVMEKRRTRPRLLDIRDGILIVISAATIVAVPSAQPSPATGRVEGRVTFHGIQPPQMTVGETGDSQPRLYVDPSGGLRYAVVYLPKAHTKRAPSTKPAVVNQRNYIFEPQVLAVRTGRTVQFTNDDVANHNVRARSTVANTFFISTGPGSIGAAAHTFGVVPENRPVLLTCDIHPWMAAWVYVFDHDAFAVTAADGSFLIDGVTPGRYRVAVRQPAGPLTRDLAIDVEPGIVTRVDVRFTAADLDKPSR